MTVAATGIDGLFVVDWPTYDDGRGFFRQTYQLSELTAALGREPVLRQGNHARSLPGVVRGFHAEPWDKLIYVARGTALAVVADIRPSSPTFATTEQFLLGDGDGARRRRLFVSRGLGNAYCTLGDQPVDYLYDVSDEYRPDADKSAIAWDDPDLAVQWPIDDPVLSEADRANPRLRERFPDQALWRSGPNPG